VIYLDDHDLHPAHRSRVLGDLREAIGSWVAPDVRFLVARFRSQLEVVVEPTADLSRVLASLEDEGGRDARGLEAELAIRQTQRAILGSYQACESAPLCVVCVDNWEQMVSFAADYARAEETRTAVAVAGLADLASALAGLPGRKDVLYVGDGFQQRPGAAMFGYVADVCADRRDTGSREMAMEALQLDESRRYTELAAHAATNRVTFHMLDAGGVRSTSATDVSVGDFRFAPTTENDSVRIENLQGTHFVIANETGGKAILNAARPRADLERLGEEISAVYSLGFTPQHPTTGRVHLLEVKLAGDAAKGRTLRYRRSYRDKQLEALLADDLVAALFLGESPNPLGIQVQAGVSQRVDRRRHELPVGILLPASALEELPGPRSLRVWMTAVSEDGRRTGIRQQILELGPGGIEPDRGVYSLVVDMELPEGDFTIAVGVRDELTQDSSFARLRASIPTPSATTSP
jgi:VWFA-related protein